MGQVMWCGTVGGTGKGAVAQNCRRRHPVLTSPPSPCVAGATEGLPIRWQQASINQTNYSLAPQVGAFAGTVTLLIEAQDEGWLGPHLAPQGVSLEAGRPIAFVYGSEERARREVQWWDPQAGPPEWTIYQEGRGTPAELTWQSYLKEGDGAGGSCG